MSDYATKVSEGFASKVVELYYESSVSEKITNSDYEGEIKNKASKVNILSFGAIALRTYTGADMTTADTPQESNAQLTTDQMKSYYFQIPSLSIFKSWIKNPEGTLLDGCKAQLAEAVDLYVLGLWGDVAAGNRLGTSFTTGTVTVDVTTGVVTHSGTGFLATMVGKPFKALGHTKWYRVAHYTSTSQIEIVDDKDDEVAAYTGGAIAGGSTFEIQALTALQTTKALIYSHIDTLNTILNENKIPKSDRWLVVPSRIASLIRQSPEYIPALESAYGEVVKRGLVGMYCGFMVYESQQVAGDSVNGWHVLAGHRSAITYALGFVETGIEDMKANFGKAYKGLTVYGAKVIDERRKAFAEAFLKL